MVLTALLLLALLLWLWQDTLQARDRAIQAAVRTCRDQQLQMLDATVSLQRIRPTRCGDGRLCLQRTFVFEYTADGDSRERGFVVMEGARISLVGLAPDRDSAH